MTLEIKTIDVFRRDQYTNSEIVQANQLVRAIQTELVDDVRKWEWQATLLRDNLDNIEYISKLEWFIKHSVVPKLLTLENNPYCHKMTTVKEIRALDKVTNNRKRTIEIMRNRLAAELMEKQ